jgi:hypothetical protein
MTSAREEQRLRREVLENDRKWREEQKRSTLLDHARAGAEMEAGGRFAKVNSAPVTAVPQYPRLPSSSPWSSDPVPQEPELGIEIGDGASKPEPDAELPAAIPTLKSASPFEGGSSAAGFFSSPMKRRC